MEAISRTHGRNDKNNKKQMALECIVKVEQCLLMDWMQDVGEIDKVKMIPRVSHRIARRKVI